MGPLQPIARDAMAAFLYRSAGQPAYSLPAVSCFTDVSRSQVYAKKMCWMKVEGISKGWPDGTYRPLQPFMGDAMAAFLQRYDATF
ncbi:S-layer homology domain-containing protein [Brachybacterium sp. UNK5269]|uniref:S-layer homology domain-containing protein n=1 Tax=Brachybacterium sp. UNK5269 TaxID=3408576 RepID=UPI003BAEF56F